MFGPMYGITYCMSITDILRVCNNLEETIILNKHKICWEKRSKERVCSYMYLEEMLPSNLNHFAKLISLHNIRDMDGN